MAKKMAAAELQLLCIDTESKFISTGFAKEVAVRLPFSAVPSKILWTRDSAVLDRHRQLSACMLRRLCMSFCR